MASRHDEQGFSLIELMVVLVIISILLAIAIPMFLGAQNRAQNRSAQANLRNALTAEKIIYTESEYYVDTTATGKDSLSSAESSISWQSGTPASTGNQVEALVAGGPVNSVTGSGTAVCLWAVAPSGVTYFLQDTGTATYYGDSNLGGTFSMPTTCSTSQVTGTQTSMAAGWV